MDTIANDQIWCLEDQQGHPSGFRLMVASTPGLRRRAYRLAHRLYREEGLVVPPGDELTTVFDDQPETVVLLIEAPDGRDVATATLTFDGPAGLPCIEDFAAVVGPWRERGMLLGEVTRLAVDRMVSGSRRLLDYLIQFALIYSWYVRPIDACVIQIGPYHRTFYERALGFAQAGPMTICRRVQRMSVLMHSDNLRCRRQLHADGCRRFHRPYFTETMEWRIAGFLRRNQGPVPHHAMAWDAAAITACQDGQHYPGIAVR